MAVLAVDIGGTKTLVTLVDGDRVLDRVEAPTRRQAGPEAWVSEMVALSRQWPGGFDQAGITVTGLIKDNHWRALNTETLGFEGQFPLGDEAEKALRVPVTLCNDAQAAAWGEYVYGAGQDKDIVFITVSTGVGGGVVSAGRLLSGRGGVAGHFGQVLPLPEGAENLFENGVSGRWIASEASTTLGLPKDARRVFAAADEGNVDAARIISASAERMGRLAYNLQLMFDPDITVVGGGIGLAPGYLDRMEASVSHFQPLVRPTFVKAALGKDAGVIGVADLSIRNQSNREDLT